MALPENPLPSCPATPNCARETRRFQADADTLVAHTRAALGGLGATVRATADQPRRLDAVCSVFIFKDDVAALVAPLGEAEAALHLRSASRTGRFDFGVNRRRVRRIFRDVARLTGR